MELDFLVLQKQFIYINAIKYDEIYISDFNLICFFIILISIGNTEIKIIPNATNVKFSLTLGIFPKKYPKVHTIVTHKKPPTALKEINLW